MTASEVMARLRADPSYVEHVEALKRASREVVTAINTSMRPLLDDLAAHSYPASNVQDLLRSYAPLPEGVVAILLKWLPRLEDERAHEALVRALAAASQRFDGAPLVRLFENSTSESFRWAVANTLAEGKATGVDEWVCAAALNPEFGKAREMLALAVARLHPAKTANKVLVRLLDEFPGHAAMGLAETGGPEELAALEGKHKETTGWVRKAIGRAITLIRRRLQS